MHFFGYTFADVNEKCNNLLIKIKNTQYWCFLYDSFAIWRKISIKKVIFHTKQNLLLDQSTWWRHKYFTFLIAMSAFPSKIRYDISLNILETKKFDMRELSKMYDFSNNCITTQMFLCKKVKLRMQFVSLKKLDM